jgi:hypothetical protein
VVTHHHHQAVSVEPVQIHYLLGLQQQAQVSVVSMLAVAVVLDNLTLLVQVALVVVELVDFQMQTECQQLKTQAVVVEAVHSKQTFQAVVLQVLLLLDIQ